MKLPQPFYRLPLRLDIERLQAEVAQFAEAEWQAHPTGFPGNSAIRLISVRGEPNDEFDGAMAPTPQLERCPYIRQVLAHLGVVWSRSRLMRLAPGASVPEHSDIDYHWFHRVRLHFPVFTQPDVRFTCGDKTVHMQAGEVWLFDNHRSHSVHNGSACDRVHLVADTCGTADFWRLALGSGSLGEGRGLQPAPIPFDPGHNAALRCERRGVGVVMPPSEVELLTADLLPDLRSPYARPCDSGALQSFTDLIRGFAWDWRSLWSQFADAPEAWPHFRELRDAAVDRLEELSKAGPLLCADTGAPASEIFYRRVLRYAFNGPSAAPTMPTAALRCAPTTVRGRRITRPSARIRRPVFIVACPRSGSTVVFETLAQAPSVFTFGGEAHFLTEGLPQLRPGASGIDSNRLSATQLDGEVRHHISTALDGGLRDRDGQPPVAGDLRWIEKTPKNALRIPFFDALFPDARFIYLWRDPRENIGSIIDAWLSGGWVTYPELPDWDGPPWSLLLPPGWERLRGRPLAEIAAYQWRQTNEIVLADLDALDRKRWTITCYRDFLRDPATETARLCRFAGIDQDARLTAYLGAPLPLSLYTLTPPTPGKWRRHARAISRVLPSLVGLEAQLEQMTAEERVGV